MNRTLVIVAVAAFVALTVAPSALAWENSCTEFGLRPSFANGRGFCCATDGPADLMVPRLPPSCTVYPP